MDKVIVITGASAGIGAELARQAGAKGAKLVLAARRELELKAAAARAGSESLTVVTDATRRSDMERLRDAALARFGRIDVWVNNAGRGITRSVMELTDEDMDSMWRDNVKSALYGMQVVLPHFQSRNAGQVVNISSGLARLPLAPFRSAYSAAKHALNGLSACLRMELRQSHPGIMVTVVMPGVVATEFGTNALGGGPDSRVLPGAQSVEDATKVIVDVIEHPRPEVYTQPAMHADVERYYHDVDAYEREAAARFRR
ncbi:SDR family NAD(P)-dependent oxidoreductase [Pyxidicoccus fallax]|uniref:SDR family NAD(P)-dependent oxidoreductase n=1 Tax=Pyxidicoccus fallax TaxID=394095 RepID=A0A848L9D7_9BACT|nr:SDR family NAD(P)-dependent oxidoreductase [Pyxidicoccus fallax]NMO15166.1 SDR family NAD(P)-dependent oxidoreductase [Pyxidicoccus fallax]NPC77788.1 SDR family NAD(P)-dependent oxidoreductase [Pyxidicoccus fallax]